MNDLVYDFTIPLRIHLTFMTKFRETPFTKNDFLFFQKGIFTMNKWIKRWSKLNLEIFTNQLVFPKKYVKNMPRLNFRFSNSVISIFSTSDKPTLVVIKNDYIIINVISIRKFRDSFSIKSYVWYHLFTWKSGVQISKMKCTKKKLHRVFFQVLWFLSYNKKF